MVPLLQTGIKFSSLKCHEKGLNQVSGLFFVFQFMLHCECLFRKQIIES